MGDRDRDEELGIPRSLLDAWAPLEPGESFAENVVERMEQEKRDQGEVSEKTSRKRPIYAKRRWPLIIVIPTAALVLVAVGVQILSTTDATSSGEIVATRRETVHLGNRAVAVAEAGAELRWSVDANGEARVEQEQGKVFYRVERASGDPFVVVTPEGEARVLGTSFHVEVEPMRQIMTKRNAASAVVGAALAAAVVVTVYEGRVALATSQGETEIGPGEVAWARGNSPPSQPIDVAEVRGEGTTSTGTVATSAGEAIESDDEDVPAPVLRERLAALRAQRESQDQELGSLRARLRELEGASDGRPSKTGDRRSNPWYPPTPEDLEEMVSHCAIRSDLPPVMGLEPGVVGNKAERMGLSEAEEQIVNDTIRGLHQSFLTRLRSIYLEATGDETGAQSLSADAMLAQIYSTALDGEVREAHLQLARERAGQAEPMANSDDLPLASRALRLHANLGDELQHLLSEDLGQTRAHELRAANGGWPWGRSNSRTCSPSAP